MAAASCERAFAIQPEFADALINLGNVRAAQWGPGDAQSLYERALRLNPRNVDAYRNLGKLFMDQGRVGEAITSYRRVLEFDRDQAHAYLELGAAHLHAVVGCCERVLSEGARNPSRSPRDGIQPRRNAEAAGQAR